MANLFTKAEDLIVPEVLADMVAATLPGLIKVSPLAEINTDLVGQPGHTITVPVWEYAGDAVEVAEGVEVAHTKMKTKSEKYEIKKIMQSIIITDEAVLSGYGDPLTQVQRQLALAFANTIDNDALTALTGATLKHDAGTGIISYEAIVDALDKFDEEVNQEKVIFINPKQVTQLRKDENFISRECYGGDVVMTGEIGQIAGCRVVPLKKIAAKSSKYVNPIVQIGKPADGTLPALTIYLKRDLMIETDRIPRSTSTEITGHQFYVAALTNKARVVALTTAAAAA